MLPTQKAAANMTPGAASFFRELTAMFMRFACFLIVVTTYFLPLSAAQAATAIGKVVAVLGSPSASGPGGDRKLSSGSAVFEDDKITVVNGNAQIILNDDTRLVVGPGSSLILDRFVMRGGNRAQKVSLKALRGTFRFITGRSSKSAYDIQTANATIGIRGTGFDFAYRGQTAAAVMDGVISLCDKNRVNCVELEDDCEVGRVLGGNARELTSRNAAQNIVNNLPYIFNQGTLRSQFHLATERCRSTLNTLRPEEKNKEPFVPDKRIEEGCEGNCPR